MKVNIRAIIILTTSTDMSRKTNHKSQYNCSTWLSSTSSNDCFWDQRQYISTNYCLYSFNSRAENFKKQKKMHIYV